MGKRRNVICASPRHSLLLGGCLRKGGNIKGWKGCVFRVGGGVPSALRKNSVARWFSSRIQMSACLSSMRFRVIARNSGGFVVLGGQTTVAAAASRRGTDRAAEAPDVAGRAAALLTGDPGQGPRGEGPQRGKFGLGYGQLRPHWSDHLPSSQPWSGSGSHGHSREMVL